MHSCCICVFVNLAGNESRLLKGRLYGCGVKAQGGEGVRGCRRALVEGGGVAGCGRYHSARLCPTSSSTGRGHKAPSLLQ